MQSTFEQHRSDHHGEGNSRNCLQTSDNVFLATLQAYDAHNDRYLAIKAARPKPLSQCRAACSHEMPHVQHSTRIHCLCSSHTWLKMCVHRSRRRTCRQWPGIRRSRRYPEAQHTSIKGDQKCQCYMLIRSHTLVESPFITSNNIRMASSQM